MIGGNPNYWNLYATKGHIHDDLINDIENLNKNIASLKRACITSSSLDNTANGNNWTKIARFNMNHSWAECSGSLTFLSVEGFLFNSTLRFFIRMTKDTTQNPTVRLYWQSCDGNALENCVVLQKVSDGVFDLWLKSLANWQTFYITLDNCSNPGFITLYDRQGWVDGSNISALDYSRYQTQGTRNKKGAWWSDGAVVVGTDGVCEVGKYLDFHTGHGNTTDNDARLEVGAYDFWFSKNINPSNTLQLGSTSNRWTHINLVNSPNISSDRNMKKDIKYLCHEKSDTELDYGDMYDFVKDELELAEYKFKNGKDKKVGFIAQDLLYDNEYNDSKVGQFIVPPIATPTDEEKAEIMERLREGEEYKDPTLSYDMSNYINVLAGALKVSINKIDELTNRAETLEQTVNQLLDKVNSDL